MTVYELLPNGKVIVKRYKPSPDENKETRKESVRKSNKADNQRE